MEITTILSFQRDIWGVLVSTRVVEVFVLLEVRKHVFEAPAFVAKLLPLQARC